MWIARGDILESRAEALTNPVNTVGVMGKGLARRFREKFPENYKAYRDACSRGLVEVGKVFVYLDVSGKYIFNFPTKKHWREGSKLEYIESGMVDLTRKVVELGIKSIAIPALGTGNGGLPWGPVREVIIEHSKRLPKEVDVMIYEPLDRVARFY